MAINYAEGPDTGPPLVMLHGLTASWESFREFMPRLSGGWHVYACDLRGHGKSGREAGCYRLADYIRDTVAFVRSLDGPAVLIGHSLGALISAGTAAEAPECARGAALLDPPLFRRNTSMESNPSRHDWFGWAFALLKSGPSPERILAECRIREPRMGERSLRKLAEQLQQLAPDTCAAVLDNSLLEDFPWERTLRSIRCPVLLMRGEWDSGSTIREEDAAWFQAGLPSAKIVRIAGGSHNFFRERRIETLEILQGFLESLQDRKPA